MSGAYWPGQATGTGMAGSTGIQEAVPPMGVPPTVDMLAYAYYGSGAPAAPAAHVAAADHNDGDDDDTKWWW